MADKKKLLYYGDTPTIGTGFGNVARHVLKRVEDRYDITVFAVNEFSAKSVELPYKVIPAIPNKRNDPFGRSKFAAWMLQYGRDFDIWWLQNDIHFWSWLPEFVYTIRSYGANPHIFLYTVVDSPVNRLDIYNLSCADVCGIPSMYGIKEILKTDPAIKYKLRHVPHGVDPTEFYPLPRDQVRAARAEKFGLTDKDFLITNVNRNSTRKDVVRTLLYYVELRKTHPECLLYLHMQDNEEDYRGFNLERILKINESTMKRVATPQGFSADTGVALSVLNLIYNCSDMIVSTTLGEGFGLSTLEAMAAKTLVMMPDNSSLSELMADGRGISIQCGQTVNDWVILKHDVGFSRPVTDIKDMVEKTAKVLQKFPSSVVEKAYQWATNDMHWDKVVKYFIDGFENPTKQKGLEGGLYV